MKSPLRNQLANDRVEQALAEFDKRCASCSSGSMSGSGVIPAGLASCSLMSDSVPGCHACQRLCRVSRSLFELFAGAGREGLGLPREY